MLADKIKQDTISAMKSGETDRVSVLRMVTSAISYAKIDAKRELNDEETIEVLRREAKKRREAIEAYSKAGRTDLAAKEEAELKVIESYLPSMMSEDEVRAKIVEILKDRTFNNFGEAMRDVMPQFKGKAEGGVVARILQEQMAS